MASYTIHLAVAKLYLEKHPKIKQDVFNRGVVMPDLLKKPESHYGMATSSPNLEKFKSTNNLQDDFKKGYYLHLKTDYLYYNEFITKEQFTEKIYDDYDKINQAIIERYQLDIPEEVKEYVKFQFGTPSILHIEEVILFIDILGNLELEEMLLLSGEIMYRVGKKMFWNYRQEKIDRTYWRDSAGHWLEKAAGKGHPEAMLCLAALYMWEGYCWEDIELDCGELYKLAWYVDYANTEAEKWLQKLIEVYDSNKAMYMLGCLYSEPYGCTGDDGWYPGEKPEYWNEENGKHWKQKALERGFQFADNFTRYSFEEWLFSDKLFRPLSDSEIYQKLDRLRRKILPHGEKIMIKHRFEVFAAMERMLQVLEVAAVSGLERLEIEGRRLAESDSELERFLAIGLDTEALEKWSSMYDMFQVYDGSKRCLWRDLIRYIYLRGVMMMTDGINSQMAKKILLSLLPEQERAFFEKYQRNENKNT